MLQHREGGAMATGVESKDTYASVHAEGLEISRYGIAVENKINEFDDVR
jgi:hypothetical protein